MAPAVVMAAPVYSQPPQVFMPATAVEEQTTAMIQRKQDPAKRWVPVVVVAVIITATVLIGAFIMTTRVR